MVDFHTHILPELDDGASNVDESLEMLKMQLQQGVNTVVATPHFSFDNIDVEKFCDIRNKSYSKLLQVVKERNLDVPDIILGAEVKITPHLSRRDGLEKLCIGNTRLILLEMPYRSWSENWVFDEIFSVIVTNKLIPVIAHIDRYIEKKKDYEKLKKLFRMSVDLQVNIDSYGDRHCRKIIDKLIKEEHAHVVGSDCHNTSTRPPKLFDWLSMISKKHGSDIVNQFEKNALKLLNL